MKSPVDTVRSTGLPVSSGEHRRCPLADKEREFALPLFTLEIKRGKVILRKR